MSQQAVLALPAHLGMEWHAVDQAAETQQSGQGTASVDAKERREKGIPSAELNTILEVKLIERHGLKLALLDAREDEGEGDDEAILGTGTRWRPQHVRRCKQASMNMWRMICFWGVHSAAGICSATL